MGITIGVISKSIQEKFQNSKSQYTRKTKCSNFYSEHIELNVILRVTVDATLANSICEK